MTAAHRLRRLLVKPFARHPFAVQRVRWPNPFRPPYLQPEINLYRPGELGDVIMCLAVVRAIREKNPAARITFVTQYHALLAGHPLIDRVLSPDEAARVGLRNVISLRYELFTPLRFHFIDYLAGCVGLRNITHDIPLPDFTNDAIDLLAQLPAMRPRVVVCRKSGAFTPNKDWPDDRWNELIARLTTRATVVELGVAAPAQPVAIAGNYVDLRGRTTQRQFCALIAHADLLITPATSALHIAAAYDVPTIGIISGYELPINSAYPHHTALHHAVPCAPCWLRTPCPFELKCLRGIAVEDVMRAAEKILAAAST